MNESQMKTLVATVDAGSMTKAAKALYLTTPALMQRIKSLEAELGFSLLIRSKLGVSPTKDGKRMYEAFKAAPTILDEAKNGGGVQLTGSVSSIWAFGGVFLPPSEKPSNNLGPRQHLTSIVSP